MYFMATWFWNFFGARPAGGVIHFPAWVAVTENTLAAPLFPGCSSAGNKWCTDRDEKALNKHLCPEQSRVHACGKFRAEWS